MAAVAAGAAAAAGKASTVANVAQAVGGVASTLGATGLFRASLRKQIQANKELAEYNDWISDVNADKAWERQLMLNQIQYEQNSYPTLMKQLEEAGLNKSLALGSASGGGQGGGSPAPMAAPMGAQSPDIAALSNAGSMGLTAGGGMVAELAKIAAEIKVAESAANKNNAEADSIRGEEGTVGESQIAKNMSDIGLNKSAEALNNANKELATFEQKINNATETERIEMVKNQLSIQRMAYDTSLQELRQAEVETDVKRKTAQNVIIEQAGRAAQAIAAAYKIEREIDYMGEQIAVAWADIANAKDANELRDKERKANIKIQNMFGEITQRGQNLQLMGTERMAEAIVYGNVAGGIAGAAGAGAVKNMPTWANKIPQIGF